MLPQWLAACCTGLRTETRRNRESEGSLHEHRAGNSNEYSVGTPRWVALAVVGLAAVSVLGVGIGWNANAHARNTEQTLQAQTQQNKTLQQGIDKISERVAQSEDTNTQLQGN